MENFSEITENCVIYSRVAQKGRDIIECSRDFILPDLYPDIKKVVSFSGSICPEEAFAESGRVNVSGTLSAKILFIDDEGALHSVTFTQDYASPAQVSDLDSPDDAVVISCPVLDDILVKTVNPRKVSVRGKIDARLKIWKKTSVSPDLFDLQCECESSPETKTESVSYMIPFSLFEKDLEVSDDILLQGAADKIIYCDASAEVSESAFYDGRVEVKGSVRADVVYSADSSSPMHVTKAIPFSVSLESGLSDVSLICACPFVQTVECDLSDGKIEIDISYMLVVNGYAKGECTIVSDAYMPFYESETERESVSFSVAPIKSEKNVKVALCSENALSEGSEILFVLPKAEIESVTTENGKKTALGSAEACVVYKNADGVASSTTLSGDFEIDLSDVSDSDEYLFLMRISPVSVKSSADGLCAEYDLFVSAVSWKSDERSAVHTLTTKSTESPDERKAFTVYYPSKDEGLWEIGKKYNLPVSSITAANPECEEGEALPKAILIARGKHHKK